MTEYFLITVTLLTSILRGDDKLPAIIFGIVAHLLYFFSLNASNVAQIFVMGLISDVVLVILLVSINSSLKSKLAFFLIPLAIISIAFHAVGFLSYHLVPDMDYGNFNKLAAFHWYCIIALFFLSAGGNGDTAWRSRFLRRNNNNHKPVDMVPK